jgi:hypothetical protein
VAWYGTFVHLVPLFTWWGAAVHRLPVVCCIGAAIWQYALFRRRATLLGGLAIAVTFAAALGFFEKAMVLPVVLAGLEACLLIVAAPAERRWPRVTLFLGLGAIGGAHVMLWRSATDPHLSALTTDLAYLGEYSRLSVTMFLKSLAGQTYEQHLWAGAALIALLVGASTALRPRTLGLWLVAACVTWISLISTGLSSARAAFWGLMPALGSRYYPDVMYVFVIFAAIALADAVAAPRFARLVSRRVRAVAIPLLVAGVWTLGAIAYVNGTAVVRGNVDVVKAGVYLRNVRAGIRRVEGAHPDGLVPFTRGMVPPFMQMYRDVRGQHGTLLSAMGARARIARRGKGVYRITPEGTVVPSLSR